MRDQRVDRWFEQVRALALYFVSRKMYGITYSPQHESVSTLVAVFVVLAECR